MAGLAVLATGCASIEDTVGPLPDAMRMATSELGGRGYPDLSRVPAVPGGLPGEAAWGRMEARLIQQRRALDARPEAAVLTPAQVSLAWAQGPRAAMDADPRSGPVPDTLARDTAWAEAERARMEAALGRLPPVPGVPD